MLSYRQAMMGGAAVCAVMTASPAWAQQVQSFDIPAQAARTAIPEFGRQSGLQILASKNDVGEQRVNAIKGEYEPREALRMMLAATDLKIASDDGRTVTLAQDPQGGSAAGGGATVEALIVTAQKREEDIQDVPIAISAFSQEDLTRSQVAGGPDLMTQVPNMTFTKTNFSSYSIQLRGIGTQAISATTDAAVAVAFNNTPFIRNHFFEQEFYDLQRVEVLRGPQGTLYGRNATAGVVNVISAKPKFYAESRLAADVANYSSSRLEGIVNIPLVEDAVALRLAGAWTKRNGYVTNEITGSPIDGRDLWSTRVSLRFTPNDRIDANLTWEHFEENDDRLRSGKQLCKTDTVTHVGDIPIQPDTNWQNPGNSLLFSRAAATFSQGCGSASLYSPDSFGTPNGLSLPYYLPLGAIFLPTALDDPYVNRTQSHDLRVIESTVDPVYKARNDLGELQISIDLSDGLTLVSETAYSADSLFSQEDYNRFNTAPGAWESTSSRPGVLTPGPNGGIFCDPQLGCTDRLVAVDVSQAKSRQFSQEFRLGSDFDGPLNFSLGVNWLRFDNEDKYYVFVNSLGIIAAISPFSNVAGQPLPPYEGGVTDNADCMPYGLIYPDPAVIQPVTGCTFIDNNPIGSLNDLGHNYFLSKNPYKLISYAAFGEIYYNVTDTLKITGGLRWTVDKKQAPRIPSWVLAGESFGYPVTEVVDQEWREPTGRLTIDWKPDLSFTDETLLYGSYAHGYKAGGANPPPTGPVKYCIGCGQNSGQLENAVVAKSATHPKTFEPEFVNAYEVGAKNTLLDGRLTLNLAAFYYDYTGYQISQIVNRSAVNLNFDADIWGLEIEANWRPLENLRFGFKGGYENTRVADGQQAIDLMDRTAGHDDWLVVKPFPTFPSNCVLPLSMFERPGGLYKVGNVGGGGAGGCEIAYVLGLDPVTEQPYDPDTHITNQGFSVDDPYLGFDPSQPDINNGEGFYKDLSGNELPNAPHYTATITADYTVPLAGDWLVTLHTDLYYQSEAWTRIFNMEGYDKLKAYTNVNLAAIFTNEEHGWNVMAYVKNVMDRDSITGAFLNSDDTGLTTNVFLTEPRLYGLRVTKAWDGVPLGTLAERRDPDRPYVLRVEVGGQVQQFDAPYDTVGSDFGGAFASAVDPISVQHRDLDYGDGRDVKLTYRPGASPWTVSAGVRFGKTNSFDRRIADQDAGRACLVAAASCAFYVQFYGDLIYFTGPNYTVADVTNREQFMEVQFSVGRDFGLGMLGPDSHSRLSAGLRYDTLESRTAVDTVGVPDWTFPDENVFFTPIQHHRYTADVTARREFEGTGPSVAWDASRRLFGDDQMGHVDLDWSVGGGVLFGKQDTAFSGQTTAQYFNGPKYGNNHLKQVGDTDVELAPAARSNAVTVPVIDLSLGLSYEIQRLKVSTGYRWERYFDVIDGGYETSKDEDRTIDGPYFKLSVGFGG